MARKQDSKDDFQARTILDNLSTKTIGPPATATGLTGDQLPDTVFSVAAFDLIRNQLNLMYENLESINVLNSIGRLSNTQSTSGPLIGTAQLIATTGISNSLETVFKPDSSQVWQLYACSIATLDGASSMILKLYDGSTQVVIDSGTSTSGEMELNEPVFVTSDAYLVARTSDASGGNAQLASAVVRVR